MAFRRCCHLLLLSRKSYLAEIHIKLVPARLAPQTSILAPVAVAKQPASRIVCQDNAECVVVWELVFRQIAPARARYGLELVGAIESFLSQRLLMKVKA